MIFGFIPLIIITKNNGIKAHFETLVRFSKETASLNLKGAIELVFCFILASTSSLFSSASSCKVFVNLSPISGKYSPIFFAASSVVILLAKPINLAIGNNMFLILEALNIAKKE